jgi:hypothetical protein
MDRKKDGVLHRLLKNWANRQGPPSDGRVRLLRAASRLSHYKANLNTLLFRPKVDLYPAPASSDWTRTLFTWVDENALQFRFQVHLI